MSYPGTQDADGPWLQGLTTAGTALQGVWITDLISYDSASNYTATLVNGLKGNWRINPTLENNGATPFGLNSWYPSSSSPTDEYGQLHEYQTSGIPLGPEDLIRVGENHAGLIREATIFGREVRLGAFDRWSTLVEVVL